MMAGKGDDDRLGVTVLSGFLGSGKTTLMKRLLLDNEKHGLKFALIVNDMNELNIDASLIKKTQSSLTQADAKMVQLQNGCICCTLREDLLIEIKRLAQLDPCPYDYLLIESTGVSEPLPVAETFTFGEVDQDDDADEENGRIQLESLATEPVNAEDEEPDGECNLKPMQVLGDIARLDTMVTVVDASTFQSHFKDSRMLSEAQNDVAPDDDRTIVNLLVDQVEFANVIILNKLDLVNEEQLKFIRSAIQSLNPEAEVIETTYSKVDTKRIVDTNMFDMERASMMPMWLKEIRGQHVPETEEYGISSFIYKARRPFHPQRLHELHTGDKLKSTGLLRSKGFCWVATCNDESVEWSATSEVYQLVGGNPWLACIPRDQWIDELPGDNVEEVLKTVFFFEGKYGDRRQEIVFIGFDTAHEQRPKIEALLNDCLLTEEEFALGPFEWDDIENDLDIVFNDDEEYDDEDEENDEEDRQ